MNVAQAKGDMNMEQAKITNLGVNPIYELKLVREQIKALQTLEDGLKSQINNLLDSSGLEELLIGTDKIKRCQTERECLDNRSLASLHPEVYQAFLKKQVVISLRIL